MKRSTLIIFVLIVIGTSIGIAAVMAALSGETGEAARDELAAQNSRVLDFLEQKSQEASHDWRILEHYLVCIERMNMAAGPDSAATVTEARRDAIAHRDSLRMRADSTRIKYETLRQALSILKHFQHEEGP